MDLQVDPSRLRGTVAAPPDKSISHRAALLGAMASEPVRITGYLDAEDTNSTLAAVAALGALVDRTDEEIVVRGAGLREARETREPIDVGNAGTLMRLLPGWLASQEGRTFTLDGDASIRRRPVDRIAEPLRRMGAELEATDGRFPPFTVRGARLRPIAYEMPVASAQVKSCVLLAGLAAGDPTTVVEPQISRDHTERMLARLGAAVHRHGRNVTVTPADELVGAHLHVPGDPSSAAFWLAAGAIVGGAEVRVTGMGTNWTRIGFVRVLERMGADVRGELERPDGDIIAPEEPVSDIEVRASALQGTVVEGEEIPLAIDELPLVGLLGCFAEGETIVRGAAELRVKESDRIAAVVDGLNALGGDLEALPDGLVVRGTGGLRGGVIDAAGDHRTAMLGAIAGLASREGVRVIGMEAAAVSYPGFTRDLEHLVGMNLRARLALLAAVLVALFVVFGILQVVSRDDVQDWIEPLGGWGAPAFAVLSAVLGCLLVPGPLLAAASGVLFGTWVGFVVTLASAVLAALIGWTVGRTVGEAQWRHRELLQRRGLWAVVVQRLLPGVPDAPVNYLAGVAGVRAWHLALGTAIGVAPRAFAYTALGDALGERSTVQTVAALALLGVTAIAGLIVAKRAVRTSGGPPPPADTTFRTPRPSGRRRHP